MQTILVPVDFSAASHNAAVYAAAIASRLNARILLFHAYMLPTPVGDMPYLMVTVDDLQQEHETAIKKEAAKLQASHGVEVEWLVRIGIPSDEIKVLTTEKQADLVVMGMKGAGGLDKIIGSTTTSVIRKVKTPVLIIPHDAAYKAFDRIVYASDFSYTTTSRLFNPLLQLVKAFGGAIAILHVNKPDQAAKGDQKVQDAIFAGYAHEYVSVTDSSVTHGIHNYLQQHPADLLVMVAHKHTFFERIFSKTYTTAMTYETHVPLLILQDKE